jgi:hypothetical protein
MSARLPVLLAGIFGILAAAGILAFWLAHRASAVANDEGREATVRAADGSCGYFKVLADTLSVFKEARSASQFIVMLNRNDIVCVAREQQVGDLVWAFVAYKLEKQNQPKVMEGWGIKRSLQPATTADLAALGPTPASAPPPAAPPPAAAPPAAAPPSAVAPAPVDDIVRFSQPLTTGPFPVSGHSLEELIAGTPMFPPIKGLDESVWKKACSNCHKWDRQTLCTQAGVYVKDPKAALRTPHPYGGAEKMAMMKWAEGGCQ